MIINRLNADKSVQEPSEKQVVPHHFEVVDESGQVDKVDRSISHDFEGNRDVAVPCIEETSGFISAS